MKILMKDYTPHHIVEAYEYDKDKPKLASNYPFWQHYESAHVRKDQYFKSFVLVQEIEPTTLLISYKAYRAYDDAIIHSNYINFPYQYLFWRVYSYQNMNTKDWKTSIISPEILFSTSAWSDESPDSDMTYKPWLSNILGRNLGYYFCPNVRSSDFPRSIHEDLSEEPTVDILLDSIFLEKMVKFYDSFLEEPFNADAGGLRLKSSSSRSAIVAPFRKIKKLSFDEILDPDSDWYKNNVYHAESKATIKDKYQKSSL